MASSTLHGLFEAQVERTPNAPAVELGDAKLTYRELDERANKLAHHLRSLGVDKESVVGLCVERSLEMVVGIYGILKAGAAYAPLDPTYPGERIAQMNEDCGAPVVVTQSSLADKVKAKSLVRLDADADAIAKGSSARPNVDVAPANAAYVIFTSGSTGRPKGTVVEHSAIVNHTTWMQKEFPLGADDAVLQKTAFSFDASVWEFHSPLANGARLVLAKPDGHRDPQYLVQLIEDARVTTLQVVPSLLGLLLEEEKFGRTSLRRVFCGGEALAPALVKRFQERSSIPLVNLYGPTEATVDTTFWVCTAKPEVVLIGRAIDNVTLHVVGEDMKPAKEGELLIGGAALARGYLNRPELTAEKFIAGPSGRAYRTGDRVRQRDDGLEFLGRTDHQVKIRGFRIELGEVETALRDAGAKDAVVIARPDGGGLVGYVLGESVDAGPLRSALGKHLPEYMVPSAIVAVKEWPLGPSGKVDRQALPAAPPAASPTPTGDSPPGNIEAVLVRLWCELLKLPTVGIHDNFFALGGHSLLAIQMVTRIRKELGIKIPLRKVLEAPTIAQLAQLLASDADQGLPVITPVAHDAVRTLSEAQRRVWASCKPGTPMLNHAGALRFRGPLDVEAMKRAVEELQARHELLRTAFERQGETGLSLRVMPPFAIEWIDSAGSPEERETALRRHVDSEMTRPFMYTTGEPTTRFSIVRLGPEEHAFMLTTHGMILGGSSDDIALEDLCALYHAFHTGEAAPPAPTVSYADFVDWETRMRQTERYRQEEAYWAKQMEGAIGLDLPYDEPQEGLEVIKERAVLTKLGTRIDQLARQSEVTRAAVFAALYAATLHVFTKGQRDITTLQFFENRSDARLARVVGDFATVLPIRVQIAETDGFSALAKKAMKSLNEAYANADVSTLAILKTTAAVRSIPLGRAVLNIIFATSAAPPHAAGGLEVSAIELNAPETRKSDLAWIVDQNGDDFPTIVLAAAAAFRKKTIVRLAEIFCRVAQAVIDDPQRKLTELL